MKSKLKTLSSLLVSALMALPLPAFSGEGVPINEHLGQWSAAVGPYSAGNMVIHDHKTWLSLVNGNDSKPGARNAAERWRLVGHARPSDYRVGEQGFFLSTGTISFPISIISRRRQTTWVTSSGATGRISRSRGPGPEPSVKVKPTPAQC